MIEGIRLAAERASIGLPDLDAILHGTTVATNAVLERRGALVGLIVTQGFRQILHLAEAWTPGPLFGFMVYEKPEPLTDTRYVREVPERQAPTGRSSSRSTRRPCAPRSRSSSPTGSRR